MLLVVCMVVVGFFFLRKKSLRTNTSTDDDKSRVVVVEFKKWSGVCVWDGREMMVIRKQSINKSIDAIRECCCEEAEFFLSAFERTCFIPAYLVTARLGAG